MSRLLKTSETYEVIAKYLKDSLGFETQAIHYAGTHSSNGLTSIVHYDIKASLNGKPISKFRATVYWNNDVPVDALPTITRMDVV